MCGAKILLGTFLANREVKLLENMFAYIIICWMMLTVNVLDRKILRGKKSLTSLYKIRKFVHWPDSITAILHKRRKTKY